MDRGGGGEARTVCGDDDRTGNDTNGLRTLETKHVRSFKSLSKRAAMLSGWMPRRRRRNFDGMIGGQQIGKLVERSPFAAARVATHLQSRHDDLRFRARSRRQRGIKQEDA